jgi:hypothetical protein
LQEEFIISPFWVYRCGILQNPAKYKRGYLEFQTELAAEQVKYLFD